MPSHIKRIIIEEYPDGGFAVFDETEKEDFCGLTSSGAMNLLRELVDHKWMEENRYRRNYLNSLNKRK